MLRNQNSLLDTPDVTISFTGDNVEATLMANKYGWRIEIPNMAISNITNLPLADNIRLGREKIEEFYPGLTEVDFENIEEVTADD